MSTHEQTGRYHKHHDTRLTLHESALLFTAFLTLAVSIASVLTI